MKTAIAALVMVFALPTIANAAGIDSLLVDDLRQQLERAHYARVGIAGRTYVLVKPVPEPEGLRYRNVESLPHRPAIITGSDRDTVPTLANPVSWSSIDRLDAGIDQRWTGAKVGGLIGFVTGAAWGGAWAGYSEFYDGKNPWMTTLVSGAVGAVVGAGIGALFTTRRWESVPLMSPRGDER